MTNALREVPTNRDLLFEKLGLDVVLHEQRVAELSLQIGMELGLKINELLDLAKEANIHDIGKANIPEKILYKPGILNNNERKEIEKHSLYSAQIIIKIPELKKFAKIVLFHHENFDGSGYFKVKGDNIPLHSRIITVADCYDAMINDRPYRKAKSLLETLKTMNDEAKYKYDPQIYEAFLCVIKG